MLFQQPKWSSIPPRAWQQAAMRRIIEHYTPCTAKPAVVSAIMGAGKSVLIAETCACASTESVIVVSTPTELLVRDLYQALKARCGSLVGIWYGRRKILGRIVVTCVPSLRSLAAALAKRSLRVGLWIADEAHKTEAETVITAHEALLPEYVLGFTATPYRAEKESSLSIFEECIYRYGIAEAQADGVIVPWQIEHFSAETDLDAGCLAWIQERSDPGIVNAFDCDDADQFAVQLTASGIPASVVHSQRHVAENARALTDLQSGKLRCVVHVNMLSEGANYPWLRWMALRRQVSSRVRFLQEIGRLLRAWPGKREAVFLDPHDLFGAFRLTYEEALGERPPLLEEEPLQQEPEHVLQMILEPDEGLALSWIESMIRSLVIRIEALGWAMGRRKILSRDHRTKPATAIQQVLMRSAFDEAQDFIPDGWRGCLQAILDRCDLVRFGFAADLALALRAVAKAGRWPDLVPAELPTRTEAGGQLVVDFQRL